MHIILNNTILFLTQNKNESSRSLICRHKHISCVNCTSAFIGFFLGGVICYMLVSREVVINYKYN
jgi:hypothetical protein